MVFLYVIEHTMLPLFTLVLIGFLVDRKFHIPVGPLSKFMFYLVIPCFIFTNIYTTEFPDNSLSIIACLAIFMVFGYIIANAVSSWRHYDAGMVESCRNALMFNNTGNLGVAMITLVFSHAPFVVDGKTPYLQEALIVQIIIFVVQSCALNTLGLYQAARGKLTVHDTLKVMFEMPMVYMLVAVIFCRTFSIDATQFYFWPVMTMASQALTPLAMFIIGVQLSQIKIEWLDKDVWLVSLIKFFIFPLLGIATIYGANAIMPGTFTAVGAMVFLIYSAVPTAVNTAMFAVEFGNNPDYATQVVMNTTVLSALSMTLVIFIGHILFV